MAITITKAPYNVSPSGNYSLFTISSNITNLIYFQLDVIEINNNKIITSSKYFPRPNNPSEVSFDLSTILKNLVETEVNNDNAVIASVVDGTLEYRLKITEYIASGADIITGEVYDNLNDKYLIWDAELDRVLFNKYNQYSFNVNDNQPIHFLSTKQQITKQSSTSAELLYFLNSNNIATKVRINLYKSNGDLKDSIVVPLPEGDLIRLNVSAKILNTIHDIDFSDVGHYRVELLNDLDEVKSETKAYILENAHCSYKPINIIYKNSLGGFDSWQFYNPIETVNITKTTMNTNVLRPDNNGQLNDNNNGVLNSDTKIINVKNKSTFKVFSDTLNDYESIALREIYTSSAVFVELQDNTLVPITIKGNSYKVQQKYTNGTKGIRVELEFESLFIPSNYSLGNGVELSSAMLLTNDLPVPVTPASGIIYHNSNNGILTL